MERKEKTASQIHIAPQIHKDTAEEILQAFRTYLASHPAIYFNGMDSIAEFLYIQFTETNPVESKEVKEPYIAFMDELVKLTGLEGAERLQSMVNMAFSEYEKTAYMEGIKLGVRIVMELGGVMVTNKECWK